VMEKCVRYFGNVEGDGGMQKVIGECERYVMEEYSKSCKNVDSDRVMLKVRKKN
jgi:hypothetical protein